MPNNRTETPLDALGVRLSMDQVERLALQHSPSPGLSLHQARLKAAIIYKTTIPRRGIRYADPLVALEMKRLYRRDWMRKKRAKTHETIPRPHSSQPQ